MEMQRILVICGAGFTDTHRINGLCNRAHDIIEVALGNTERQTYSHGNMKDHQQLNQVFDCTEFTSISFLAVETGCWGDEEYGSLWADQYDVDHVCASYPSQVIL